MSIAETKARMLTLLADRDNQVVALSGKWGTGKSHLWRDVKSASPDAEVQKSLYASLFGLSDMIQLKLKLVEGAVPDADNRKKLFDSIKVVAGGVKKILVGLNKGFSALDELALLVLPTFLKDRVIVLDDIERKHDKLSIDEVLGFIDEFTQRTALGSS